MPVVGWLYSALYKPLVVRLLDHNSCCRNISAPAFSGICLTDRRQSMSFTAHKTKQNIHNNVLHMTELINKQKATNRIKEYFLNNDLMCNCSTSLKFLSYHPEWGAITQHWRPPTFLCLRSQQQWWWGDSVRHKWPRETTVIKVQLKWEENLSQGWQSQRCQWHYFHVQCRRRQ